MERLWSYMRNYKEGTISQRLDKVGLDSTRWLPILDRFGFKRVPHLQFIDEQTFRQIVKKKQHSFEASALAVVFGVDKKKWTHEIHDEVKPIEAILEENDLDVEHWKEKFENFGLKNTKYLKHVDKKTFQELKKEIKYDWEINALRKCLKIGGSDKVSNKSRDYNAEEDVNLKEKEVFKKLNEEREEMMLKVTKLMDEEKRRNTLKSIDENLIKNLETKESVMKQSRLSETGKTFATRKPLSDSDLIRMISAGVILKGHYLQHDTETASIPRKTILAMPPNITINLPSMSETFHSLEFFDQLQSDRFKHVIKHGGLSVAMSFRADFLSLSGSGGVANAKIEDEKTQTSKQHSFAEVQQMLMVPVASFTFENTTCFLSEHALKALKYLASLNISKEEFTRMSQEFFDEFGSHYYTGIYHFGGSYHWDSKCTITKTGNHVEALKMAKYALHGSVSGSVSWVSASASVSIENSSDERSQNREKAEKSIIEKSLYKHGGPQEVDDISLWKLGLADHNKTWTVIDKKPFDSKYYRGVWTLIENHATEFRAPVEFASKLEDAWKELINKEELEAKRIHTASREQGIRYEAGKQGRLGSTTSITQGGWPYRKGPRFHHMWT